jgi:hypothetical protein
MNIRKTELDVNPSIPLGRSNFSIFRKAKGLRPDQASWRGFVGRLYLAGTIVARYPIEDSMDKGRNNLTLHDEAS